MWRSEKNNFIKSFDDVQMFQQLPVACQRQIFTDFLFQHFLFKFRRFFRIRVDILDHNQQLNKQIEE